MCILPYEISVSRYLFLLTLSSLHLTTTHLSVQRLRSTLNRNSENTRHILITRAKKNLRGNMTCDQYCKVHIIICATFLGSAVYIYNSSQNGGLSRAGQVGRITYLGTYVCRAQLGKLRGCQHPNYQIYDP